MSAMIRRIEGTVVSRGPVMVVIDVAGVGYLVYSPHALERFTLGERVALHTHLAVRENALDLYGFQSEDELEMFELLIDLPKIGPKTALQIMTQADVELLRSSALSGDASYLSKISGIGKKSAEKIVVGLRDKFGAEDLLPGARTQADHDVIDALMTLGYSQKECRDAMERIPPDLTDTNERIKAALKQISR